MNSIRSHLVVILLMLLGQPLTAQTVWRGEVTEKVSGDKVGGAMLFLIDGESNRSLAVTQSDDEGRFEFRSKATIAEGHPVVVRGTLVGYLAYKERLVYRSGVSLKLQMEATSYELREVKIEAPAVREVGDTIIYRASAFAQKQDKTISQVIARMPGLEVVGGGQIRYEGKAINKFYIEQMDLLGRRYSIASNSLRPEDVASVEVYRNHEPIRMLTKESLSDRAALNIRLTEQAKGRWLAWAAAGVGVSPFLYDFDGRLMRLLSTSQGIYLAKANDTGRDMTAELRDHELSMSRRQHFSLNELAALDFYQSMSEVLKNSPMGRRARFNHSHVLSGNHLFKVGEHRFLRFNATYLDELTSSSRSETIAYSLPDRAEEILSSQQSYRLRVQKMTLGGEYEYNGDLSYFVNKSKMEYQTGHSQDQLQQDKGAYQQTLSLPYLKIENSTEWLFRISRTLLKLENSAKYLSRHQSIEISLPLSQAIESSLYDNSLSIGTKWQWGFHQFSNRIQWDIQYHDVALKSSWVNDEKPMHAGFLSNSFTYSPEYSWRDGGWYIFALLPATYYLFKYPRAESDLFRVAPTVKVSHYWDNNLKVDGMYRWYHNIVGAASQFPGLRVRDSRRLTESHPDPYLGSTHYANLGLTYTVPVSGTSILADTHYSRSRRRYTSSTLLEEGYIVMRQIPQLSYGANIGAMLRASQTFWKANLMLTLHTTYDRDWIQLFIQNELSHIITDSYLGRVEVSYQPIPELKIEYEGSLSGSQTTQTEGALSRLPQVYQQQHKGSLLWWVTNGWSATLSAVHHQVSTLQVGAKSQATFVDIASKYYGKKVEVELRLSNITNQRCHEAVTIVEPHIVRTFTPLRPFEVMLTFTLNH